MPFRYPGYWHPFTRIRILIPISVLQALSLAWWFYLSKFIDFFDSIFFILRKKFDHLSPLHVIHHSTLPFMSWFGPKFAGNITSCIYVTITIMILIQGGGNTTFGGMWNSLVHCAMYSYYFLSACGPRVQRHLWWKRYVPLLSVTGSW